MEVEFSLAMDQHELKYPICFDSTIQNHETHSKCTESFYKFYQRLL
jgi:hypothetical protein